MSYNGVLVLPRNYVVMDYEEMTYVEGGADWSAGRLANNLLSLKGYWDTMGLTMTQVLAIGTMSYCYVAANFAWVGARIGALGGWVGIVIGAVIGAAAGTTALYLLGKYDLPGM